MNQAFERALFVGHSMLRLLAPIDAVLLPGGVLWWVLTLPRSGGHLGAFVAVFCLWRALKRVSTAVYRFEDYQWTAARLLKLLALILLLRFVWWMQG